MPKLIAKLPVLYASTQYKRGDALPANKQDMINAWLKSGAAVWVEEDAPKKAPAPKATAVTAEPGLGGSSTDGDPEALVGKVTKTPQRRKKK